MGSPVKGGSVTYAYGEKNSRYASGFHTGDDYACSVGTPILATWDAKVVFAGWGSGGWGSAYGYEVILESVVNGVTVRHGYNHLSHIGVHKGMKVGEGQEIGRSGDTGMVTGPHLHYEERTSPYLYNNRCRQPWLNKHDMPHQEKENPGARGDVYVAKLVKGEANSDSVTRLRYRLQNHSKIPKAHKPGFGNDYGPQVVDAVRYWQRNVMPKTVKGAKVTDGSRVTNAQANALFGKNYRVIETWSD